MDLLFRRYASPFCFLDVAIEQHRLLDVVDEIVKSDNDKMEWDFFLHKVTDNISFTEFQERIHPKNTVQSKISKSDFEVAIAQSQEILNCFNPEREGENNGYI